MFPQADAMSTSENPFRHIFFPFYFLLTSMSVTQPLLPPLFYFLLARLIWSSSLISTAPTLSHRHRMSAARCLESTYSCPVWDDNPLFSFSQATDLSWFMQAVVEKKKTQKQTNQQQLQTLTFILFSWTWQDTVAITNTRTWVPAMMSSHARMLKAFIVHFHSTLPSLSPSSLLSLTAAWRQMRTRWRRSLVTEHHRRWRQQPVCCFQRQCWAASTPGQTTQLDSDSDRSICGRRCAGGAS